MENKNDHWLIQTVLGCLWVAIHAIPDEQWYAMDQYDRSRIMMALRPIDFGGCRIFFTEKEWS